MWWSGKQFFFWKKSKNPLISLCRSLKISGNKKIQKSLILTSVKIQETIFFGKNPKILEFHFVEVWKVQEIEISKNPWSSLIWKSGKKSFFEKIQKSLNSIVWKSGKEILFWKNPKILDSVRCYNLWTKKIVQRKNPKILEFESNGEIVQFLNKSKNP